MRESKKLFIRLHFLGMILLTHGIYLKHSIHEIKSKIGKRLARFHFNISFSLYVTRDVILSLSMQSYIDLILLYLIIVHKHIKIFSYIYYIDSLLGCPL